MNYKLEKFWNRVLISGGTNLKAMNYKLEKFWNLYFCPFSINSSNMNYKLEKFWNDVDFDNKEKKKIWTINLKSFEIR